MPRPAPQLPSERPDPQQQLLVAVAEGDGPRARRLVDQWVHRRGVAALERFLAGPLPSSQGPVAVAWLQGQLSLTALPQPLPSPPSAALAPEASPAQDAPAPFVLMKSAAAPVASLAVQGLDVEEPQPPAGSVDPAPLAADPVTADPVAVDPLPADPLPAPPAAVPAPIRSAAERLRDLPAAGSSAQAELVPPAPAPALVRRLRAWLPDEEEVAAAGEDHAYPQAS